MTRTQLVILAAGGSIALLLGALAFEHVGGMAPCALCIWQRWPHLAAALIGIVAVALQGPILPLMGGTAAATSGGIAVYHTGVERAWWVGPQACSAAGDISGMTSRDLLDQIMAAPVVRCTDVAWEMAGLSMASWNAVASFGLAGIWLWAAMRNRRA